MKIFSVCLFALTFAFPITNIHASDHASTLSLGRSLAKEVRRSDKYKRDLASYAWSIFDKKFLGDLSEDWELPAAGLSDNQASEAVPQCLTGWRYYWSFIQDNPVKCIMASVAMIVAGVLVYRNMPDVSRCRGEIPSLPARIITGVKETVASTPARVATGVGTVVTSVRKVISYGIGARLGFTESSQWFNLWNPDIPNSGTSFKLHDMAAKQLHHWYKNSAMKGAIDVIYENGKIIFKQWQGKTIEFTLGDFSSKDAFNTIANWSNMRY